MKTLYHLSQTRPTFVFATGSPNIQIIVRFSRSSPVFGIIVLFSGIFSVFTYIFGVSPGFLCVFNKCTLVFRPKTFLIFARRTAAARPKGGPALKRRQKLDLLLDAGCLAAALGCGLLVLRVVLPAAAPLLLGLGLAAVIHPAAGWLTRRLHLRPRGAALAAAGAVYLLAGAAVWLVCLLLWVQGCQLVQRLPVLFSSRVLPLLAGLGGRLDSTNVLHHPRLEVITTIGYDHMDRLGSTLTAIAGEKAGIIKPGSRVVMGYLDPEAAAVIRQKAASQQAELIETPAYEDRGPQRFRLYGQDYAIASLAKYQIANAAVALCAARALGIDITSDAVKEAVRGSRWPGRFEPVAAHPLIILDGAHNPQGMAALTASFAALPRPLAVVYSALKDKQGRTMAKMLEGWCDRLYVTQFAAGRADSAAHLAPAPELIRTDWKQAVREAREFAGADGTVVITGSLYFISDARAWLLADREDGKSFPA